MPENKQIVKAEIWLLFSPDNQADEIVISTLLKGFLFQGLREKFRHPCHTIKLIK
jgi:hypothetical protein